MKFSTLSTLTCLGLLDPALNQPDCQITLKQDDPVKAGYIPAHGYVL